MLEYLIHLPSETMGQNVLVFLDLIDIVQLENATFSHKSHQLFKAILPYCPTIVVKCNERFRLHHEAINWFIRRRCRIHHVTIDLDLLYEIDYEHFIVDNITLCLNTDTIISLQHLEPLKNPNLNQTITHLLIKGGQVPEMMEVLFSLLSCVYSLNIQDSNQSQWIEHIRKIGPFIREFSVEDDDIRPIMIKTITTYCPHLEKLNLGYVRLIFNLQSNSSILENIAKNCLHLHSLVIKHIYYNSSTEAEADLTAFAEKCPQLEELILECQQLTDQSVIALAQHWSRLKKLELAGRQFTSASLIALSEHGLPLEELDIPEFLIPSAEIAAQCAHALSRIRETRYSLTYFGPYAIQYMTGLRMIYLANSEDHLLIPKLLLLLQEHSARLKSLTIRSISSITPQQLTEVLKECPQLNTLHVDKRTFTTDAILVALAHSCPHLQKVVLNYSTVTEEGVLTLAAHCRQLREIYIPKLTLSELAVRQLVQHCPHLFELFMNVNNKENERLFSKDIRVLRERLLCRSYNLSQL